MKEIKGEVEIQMTDSRGGVRIMDHKARDTIRKEAINDMLASVEKRDDEARQNKKDCFKRPL